MLQVSVDTTQLDIDLHFIAESIDRHVGEELKSIVGEIQTKARKDHRYKSRSGRLASSVSTEVTKDAGEVYLDDGVADYGLFVHEGHGSWAPDKFLDEATDSVDVEGRISDAVERGINE